MSTIKVDTLVAADGSSAVTLTKQIAAKVFNTVDQTGTMTTLDSFNVSSISDFATGGTKTNYTNNMNNSDYAFSLSRDRTGSDNGGVVQTSTSEGPQTGSFRFNCFGENFSGKDVDRACLIAHGDLA